MGNTQLISGGAERIRDVLALLARVGMQANDPDVYVRAYPRFGIEEAREIIARATLRAMGERRVFVVAMPDITREAQNALLKTLEEPSDDALFFFIVPSPDTLLPTLRSRMQLFVLHESGHTKESVVDADTFLKASPEKRIEMLKPLLEKGDDDRRDIGAVLAFLSHLEERLARNAAVHRTAIHALYRARRYLTDKGALVKPLLEQVAILAPTM